MLTLFLVVITASSTASHSFIRATLTHQKQFLNDCFGVAAPLSSQVAIPNYFLSPCSIHAIVNPTGIKSTTGQIHYT
jgi:hypothetical protein